MNDQNTDDRAPLVPSGATSGDIYTDGAALNHAWQVARLFAKSQLVPEALRGKPADCLIALTIARDLGENPVTVLQSIFFVGGRAGWSAQYMIGRANRAGVFRGGISWRTTGAGDDLEVTAYGCLTSTGEEVTATVSMAMAKAENWIKNPKYRSMPEHMLKWRSATMLIRLYAPEIMLGYSTAEELETIEPEPVRADVVDVTPAPANARAALGLDTPPATDPEPAKKGRPPAKAKPEPVTAEPASAGVDPHADLRALIADIEEEIGAEALTLRKGLDLDTEEGLRTYERKLGAAIDAKLAGGG